MRWSTGRRSDNVVDARGGGGMGMPIAGGGIGMAVLALVVYLLGGDPSVVTNLPTNQAPSAPQGQAQSGPPDEGSEFVRVVLADTEDAWGDIFKKNGRDYPEPQLVLFSGAVRSGCGIAQSAMGPFYCPNDRKVYLDTSFFQDLERRFRGCEVGSKGCQFSQAYVITHEIGHHVQNLLGILPKVQQMQHGLDQAEANQLQVRVELQADCLSGVWAHHAEEQWRLIEPGDVEAAMQTASAIGDDRLQRRSQGYVVPDAFTHGSSAQRTRWFLAGLKSGELASCDTFGAQQW